MSDSTVLVTGANGFVGSALCSRMQQRGIAYLPVMRTGMATACRKACVKEIHPLTDWSAELKEVNAILHLAARVHLLHDSSPDPLRDYRLVNVDATLNLARQAAAAGVRRFVFLSSIKVNGESTDIRPFSEADVPAPIDPYGISKYEAEQGLLALAQQTGLEVVIIRPPLVYGPGAKANFLQLMRWVHRGIPLPLASVDNRRSMIFVSNLVDFILCCLTHEAAGGHTFLVSDNHDVSVADLIRHLSIAMGKRSPLFPFPSRMLEHVARLTGRKDVVTRLLSSLQVDIQCAQSVLNWKPSYTFEAGIEKTVRHFLQAEAYHRS